jgi:hypothetical protein
VVRRCGADRHDREPGASQAPQLDATQSDEGGRYRFTALPRGIYTLTASPASRKSREPM